MIKKIISVFIVMTILCAVFVIPTSAASLEDLSTEISSGVMVKKKFLSSMDSEYYKVKVSEKGELTLKFNTTISLLFIDVYDSNGNEVSCSGFSVTKGSGQRYTGGIVVTHSELEWNKNIERSKGTFKYKVSKGTYYIKVTSWYLGKGMLNMTADFPSNDIPATQTIQLKITMNVGDVIRLGAIVTPDDAEEVKWSTSKKSVVTVTNKGKITAKSKGTATIQAKSGGKVLKIKIVVQ